MKRVTMLLATLALAAGLTACGGGDDHDKAGHSATTPPAADSGKEKGAKRNQADTQFSLAMIPHHGQAIEMADGALKQASNPEVRKLAKAIKAAQDPEIRLMSGWLKGWDVPVPEPSMDMSLHKGHEMEGMMSHEQMQDLEQAKGRAYDKLWVEMMIEHHEGAVTMSQKELKEGAHADSKKLARAIIKGQTAEIDTMRALLRSL